MKAYLKPRKTLTQQIIAYFKGKAFQTKRLLANLS